MYVKQVREGRELEWKGGGDRNSLTNGRTRMPKQQAGGGKRSGRHGMGREGAAASAAKAAEAPSFSGSPLCARTTPPGIESTPLTWRGEREQNDVRGHALPPGSRGPRPPPSLHAAPAVDFPSLLWVLLCVSVRGCIEYPNHVCRERAVDGPRRNSRASD